MTDESQLALRSITTWVVIGDRHEPSLGISIRRIGRNATNTRPSPSSTLHDARQISGTFGSVLVDHSLIVTPVLKLPLASPTVLCRQ